MTDIYARSGHQNDVQEAIDRAIIGDNVRIPEGRFNFVEVGESLAKVQYPAGVNIFGALTERDAYGQVINWKTVLVMPWDVPGNDVIGLPIWFSNYGTSDPNKPSRFSDIRLEGYRNIDPASTSTHRGLEIANVINFRVDHCNFLNTAGTGVYARGGYGQYALDTICGVVDHCGFVNTAEGPTPWEGPYGRIVGYGVFATRGPGWGHDNEPWEDDITKILGKYLDYTVYVEDCYFEKWRHCAVSRSGAHLVLRHSTIQYDYGFGSIDIHGDVPGRALEVYENELLDPVGFNEAIWQRAGGGVIFNNRVTGYRVFAYLTRENPQSKFWSHNIWVWNNDLPAGVSPVTVYSDPNKGAPQEGVDYWLHEPHTFVYTPYPYPFTPAPPPPPAYPVQVLESTPPRLKFKRWKVG